MSLSRAELLRPSLSGSDRLRRAPYSHQVVFLGAFFGGPFAAAGLLAVNAWRLDRLRRDAAVLVVVAFAAFTFYASSRPGGLLHGGLQPLVQWLGPRTFVYAERLAALALFGIGAALHRREQRSADLFGLPRPNGWIGGIAAIAGGIALSAFVPALLAPATR
jgi:hypothetical protein